MSKTILRYFTTDPAHRTQLRNREELARWRRHSAALCRARVEARRRANLRAIRQRDGFCPGARRPGMGLLTLPAAALVFFIMPLALLSLAVAGGLAGVVGALAGAVVWATIASNLASRL